MEISTAFTITTCDRLGASGPYDSLCRLSFLLLFLVAVFTLFTRNYYDGAKFFAGIKTTGVQRILIEKSGYYHINAIGGDGGMGGLIRCMFRKYRTLIITLQRNQIHETHCCLVALEQRLI